MQKGSKFTKHFQMTLEDMTQFGFVCPIDDIWLGQLSFHCRSQPKMWCVGLQVRQGQSLSPDLSAGGTPSDTVGGAPGGERARGGDGFHLSRAPLGGRWTPACRSEIDNVANGVPRLGRARLLELTLPGKAQPYTSGRAPLGESPSTPRRPSLWVW